MARKRRRRTASGVISALLGFLCAAVLGALFYGTMVYQLAGEEPAAQQAAPAAGALALHEGTLAGETEEALHIGGALCTVITRSYLLPGGETARAITARPAAYLERLSAPGVQMQLITGFVIAGLDAVYAVSGETGLLAARDGDMVYMIEGPADQQAMYMLGAAARR